MFMFGGARSRRMNLKKRTKSSRRQGRMHDQAPVSFGPKCLSLDLPVSVSCHSTTQSTSFSSLYGTVLECPTGLDQHTFVPTRRDSQSCPER